MQIFAGSLNVQVNAFLHAGYCSAYPRTYKSEVLNGLREKTGKAIDVKKELELKEPGKKAELSQSTTTPQQTPGEWPLPTASIPSAGVALLVAFFFFGFLFTLYYRRLPKVKRPRWRPWLFALVPVFLLSLVFIVVHFWVLPKYLEYSISKLPPPWQDVPIQEYKNPHKATQAIMQSLVVPALSGCPFKPRTLGAIQNEVSFPLSPEDYTPGLFYAQKTYGLDGWGKEFRFQPFGTRQYRLTSAGPDGIFDTADDITLETPTWGDDWERQVNGFFATQAEGKPVCLIHRIHHVLFRREHAGEAQKIAGSDLFDLFGVNEVMRPSPYWEKKDPPIFTEIKKCQELFEPEGKSRPLFFVQFTGKVRE